MPDRNPRKNAAGTRGRPFAPGNPGRPKGSRNRVTVAVEALLDGQADALTRRAIQAALAGDVTALRLCLDRISPVRRERPITFDLPKVNTAADVPTAMSAVLGAVASGDLTLTEGEAMVGLLGRFREAYQATRLDREMAPLDRALAEDRWA